MIPSFQLAIADAVTFNKKLKPIIKKYLLNHKNVRLSKVSQRLTGYIRLQNLLGKSNPLIEKTLTYLADYPITVEALTELDYTQLTFNYMADLVYLSQFESKPKRFTKKSRDKEFLEKIGVLQNGN